MENPNVNKGNMEVNSHSTSSLSGQLTSNTTNAYATPAQELSAAQLEQIKGLFRPELEAEVRDTKKDFITIFGLFASFVTFLSIEVQVFKNSNDISKLIGVSALSLAFVMLFTLVIQSIVKDRTNWQDFFSPVYVIVVVFIAVGIFFLYDPRSEEVVKNNSNIPTQAIIEQRSEIAKDTMKRDSGVNKPKPLVKRQP